MYGEGNTSAKSMAAQRSKRETRRPDYFKMNVGLDQDEFSQEEELDYEEQLVVQGYEEEEGEITESEDDSSKESYCLDKQIEEVLEAGEESKAEALIKEKEKRCQSLRATLKKEQNKEDEQKKQRMLEMQAKFRKLQKTEEALNKSSASSRANSRMYTPCQSPTVT